MVEGDVDFPGGMPGKFAPFSVEEAPKPTAKLTIRRARDKNAAGQGDAACCAPTTDEPRPTGEPVAVGDNDLGRVELYRDGEAWILGIAPLIGMKPRMARIEGDFLKATLWLEEGDPYGMFCADSMLRILFSQHAAANDSLIVHASAVEVDGHAFLFAGESGTGKSTHSQLWIKNFEGAELLNDDNPLIRLTPEGPRVYGTPWSGKTPCYRNASAPLRGIARLRQSAKNRYTALDELAAFYAVLKGVSAISGASELYDRACETLIGVVTSVNVGSLECRADDEAAKVCRENLDVEREFL